MRVKVKESVNFKEEIDLKNLSPIDRIKVSIQASVWNSEFIQTQLEKQQKKKLEEQASNVDKLRRSLLHVAYEYLVKQDSDYTRDTGKKVEVISLAIPRKFEESLNLLIASRDFDSYNIKRIKENEAILLSKPDLPIRVVIDKKVL